MCVGSDEVIIMFLEFFSRFVRTRRRPSVDESTFYHCLCDDGALIVLWPVSLSFKHLHNICS